MDGAVSDAAAEGAVAAHRAVGKSQYTAVVDAVLIVAAHGAVDKCHCATNMIVDAASVTGAVAAHRAVGKSQCAAVVDAAAVGGNGALFLHCE